MNPMDYLPPDAPADRLTVIVATEAEARAFAQTRGPLALFAIPNQGGWLVTDMQTAATLLAASGGRIAPVAQIP